MNKIISKNNGFTLLEALIVIAITGVLASIAIPSFQEMIESSQLKQVLESVKSDLQFARTAALKRSSNVVFSIQRVSATAGDWCYGLTTKAIGCTCTLLSTDPAGCEIKIVSGTDFNQIRYSTSLISNITFDFRRGTTDTLKTEFPFSSTSIYKASVYIDSVGRARICNPGALTPDEIALPGLIDC